MKFGVREVADVMLKAKTEGQKVGQKTFQKGEPVCHFDSLKASTVEGASTTVYAQGGKGNPRLIAWEGERTLTFTMEEALLSKLGISLLTGAGLIEAGTSGEKIPQHITETVVATAADGLNVSYPVYNFENTQEPDVWIGTLDDDGNSTGEFTAATGATEKKVTATVQAGVAYLVDYYTEVTSGLAEFDIEPNKFGGNYYLEGSTLFRNTSGKDLPAEFILPNCKIQSNFTFSMAPTGDPSTFTFTVDAFPGVLKHRPGKKVLGAILVADNPLTLVNG